MKFFGTLLLIATLSNSILAVSVPDPAENEVDQSAKTVTCHPRPKDGTVRVEHFKVNVAHAKSEARKAGFASGRSGDPHRYMNRDRLHFGVHNCDKASALLLEYPIYADGMGGDWKKDIRTSEQDATPIRTVFANSHGGFIWCGVMTHEIVDADHHGSGNFKRCV